MFAAIQAATSPLQHLFCAQALMLRGRGTGTNLKINKILLRSNPFSSVPVQ